MDIAAVLWDGLRSLTHSFTGSFNKPSGGTYGIPRPVPRSAAPSSECEGTILPSGGVGYSLGTSAENTPGREAGAPGEFTRGPPGPGGDNALAEPRGRAGGNQVKGGVPTLASVWHNSRGRCSQSPLRLLAPAVVEALGGD